MRSRRAAKENSVHLVFITFSAGIVVNAAAESTIHYLNEKTLKLSRTKYAH